MTLLSSENLELLRKDHHKSNYYITWLPKIVIATAQVGGTPSHGDTDIVLTNKTVVTNNTYLEAGQEVWVGSTAGNNDIGITRIKDINWLGDSLTVSFNSFNWATNQHLTFIYNYPFKPVYPFIEDNGDFKKDGDIAYSGQNGNPPPVCIGGPNRAGVWRGTPIQFRSFMPESYTIKEGATISSYSGVVPVASAISALIDAGDGTGLVNASGTGIDWVWYSVTDSNGQTQEGRRLYMVVPEDEALTDFTIESYADSFVQGGKTVRIRIRKNIPLDSIPDFAPVIIWKEDFYDDTQKQIGLYPEVSDPDTQGYGNEILFSGYIKKDSINIDDTSGVIETTFDAVTLHQVSKDRYNFSVVIEARSNDDTWYKYEGNAAPDTLTAGRAVHHFMKWHSTWLLINDVYGLRTGHANDLVAVQEFEDGTLFNMPNGFLHGTGIRARLVCDKQGATRLVEDQQLMINSERALLEEVMTVEDEDVVGEVGYSRQLDYRTPFVELSGFVWDGTFDGNGDYTAQPICTVWPGRDPIDFGSSPLSVTRQILLGQNHANMLVGRYAAQANNQFPDVTINFKNYIGIFDSAFPNPVLYTRALGSYPRDISLAGKQLYVRSVTTVPDVHRGGTLVNVVFEVEAFGPDGQSTNCPTYPDYEFPPFPEAPDIHGAVITTSRNGTDATQKWPPDGDTWVTKDATPSNFMYQDPFSWTPDNTSQDIILWKGHTGGLERSIDGGETWSSVVLPDPPNDAGDVPAPTVGQLDFIYGVASQVNQQEHIWLGRYQNTSSLWRSWLYHTTDDGATWTTRFIGDAAGSDIETQLGAYVTGWTGTTPFREQHSEFNNMLFMNGHYVTLFQGTDANTVPLITTVNSAGTLIDTMPIGGTGGSFNGVLFSCDKLSESKIGWGFFEEDGGFLTVGYDTIAANGTITAGGQWTIFAPLVTTQTLIRVITLHENYFLCLCDENDFNQTGLWAYIVQATGDPAIVWGPFNINSSTVINELDAARVTDLSDLTQIIYIVSREGTNVKAQRVTWTINSHTNLNIGNKFALGGTENWSKISTAFLNNSGAGTAVLSYRDDDAEGADDVHILTYRLSSASFQSTPGVKVATRDCSATYTKPIANGSCVVLYQDESTTEFHFAEISGTDLTPLVGSEEAFPRTNVDWASILYVGGTKVYAYNDVAAPNQYTLLVPALGNIKVLGVDIGKGAGEWSYITYWSDDGALGYGVYNLLTNLVGAYDSLGPATELEVDNFQKLAMPLASFFLDEVMMFYGRMSLGGTDYALISSDDYGVTKYPGIDNMGARVLTSAHNDFGTIYFADCLGDTKLRIGSLDFSNFIFDSEVISTISSNSLTRPGGLKYNFFEDAVWCALGENNEVDIFKASYPYQEWVSFLLNHQTTNGVRSLEVL